MKLIIVVLCGLSLAQCKLRSGTKTNLKAQSEEESPKKKEYRSSFIKIGSSNFDLGGKILRFQYNKDVGPEQETEHERHNFPGIEPEFFNLVFTSEMMKLIGKGKPNSNETALSTFLSSKYIHGNKTIPIDDADRISIHEETVILAPEIFSALGYKIDVIRHLDKTWEIFVEVPDITALRKGLEANKIDLTVASSNGIASDDNFIYYLLNYDALLSTSDEILHDHFFHVIPGIHRFLNSFQLKRQKVMLRKFAMKRLESISDYPKADGNPLNSHQCDHKKMTLTTLAFLLDVASTSKELGFAYDAQLKAYLTELYHRIYGEPGDKDSLPWLFLSDKYSNECLEIQKGLDLSFVENL